MAGFDANHYRQSFLLNPGFNDAASYGVVINGDDPRPGSYRCIGVHHLTPSENAGNHHVYLDVLDEQGKRLTSARVGWTWEGKRDDESAPLIAMDKPASEPGGNIGLGMGQVVQVWVSGVVSDNVSKLHTGHPDETEAGMEYPGNTVGHHSFYVVFQRYSGAAPPTPPPSGDCAVYIARIATLEGAVQAVSVTLAALLSRLDKVR